MQKTRKTTFNTARQSGLVLGITLSICAVTEVIQIQDERIYYRAIQMPLVYARYHCLSCETRRAEKSITQRYSAEKSHQLLLLRASTQRGGVRVSTVPCSQHDICYKTCATDSCTCPLKRVTEGVCKVDALGLWRSGWRACEADI